MKAMFKTSKNSFSCLKTLRRPLLNLCTWNTNRSFKTVLPVALRASIICSSFIFKNSTFYLRSTFCLFNPWKSNTIVHKNTKFFYLTPFTAFKKKNNFSLKYKKWKAKYCHFFSLCVSVFIVLHGPFFFFFRSSLLLSKVQFTS